MAKATVLACDVCGSWDSKESPVIRVTVAGPRFELCEKDRARLLVRVGVEESVALAYQRMVSERGTKTGALPPLSSFLNSATLGDAPPDEPTLFEADIVDAARRASQVPAGAVSDNGHSVVQADAQPAQNGAEPLVSDLPTEDEPQDVPTSVHVVKGKRGGAAVRK
jgi:hypothetical protein